MRSILLLLSLYSVVLSGLAQTDSVAAADGFRFSVERDLLNLKPSADTELQSILTSGSSLAANRSLGTVYVLTRQTIQRNQATSLAEALRLIPGCRVQESAKGSYSVQLGHSEYQPTGSDNYTALQQNTALLLVDGVPWINPIDQSIWWEALPGIQNIDQIEVWIGPIGSHFGQSSSSGAINLVTRRNSLDQLHFYADAYVDQSGDNQASVFVESTASQRLQFGLNVNYSFQRRPQRSYFVDKLGRAVLHDSLLLFQPNVEQTHRFPTMGNRALFVQGQIGLSNARGSKLRIQAEYHQTEAQTAYWQNVELYLNQRNLQYTAINLIGNLRRLNFFLRAGTGIREYSAAVPGARFEHQDALGQVAYKFRWAGLEIEPQINAFYAAIDNQTDTFGSGIGLGPIRQNLITLAPHLQVQWARGPWQLLAHGGYQYHTLHGAPGADASLHAGFGRKDRQHLRLVLAYQRQSPNLWQSLAWQEQEQALIPQTELAAQTNLGGELGLRSRWWWWLETYVVLFHRLSYDVYYNTQAQGMPHFANLPGALNSYGFMGMMRFNFGKISIQPHLRLQSVSSTAYGGAANNNPRLQTGFDSHFSFFYNKLNISLSAIATSAYQIRFRDEELRFDNRIVPSFKILYSFLKENYIYFGARGALLNAGPEYLWADQVEARYLVGLRFNVQTAQ